MRHRIKPAALIVLAGLALSALAACGQASAGDGVATASGGGAEPKTSASAGTADRIEQGRKFAQCMRDNGVGMPDPDPDTGRPGFGGAVTDANRDAFRKALEKCRTLLPNGGVRPTLDAAQLEALRQFTQCMRDNGVDMPDPDPNAGDFGFGGAAGRINRDSPAFQKALEACRSKLPQFRGGRNS
ncbi:MAG TPA: hypothetical protein VFE14_15355 [Micromonosporaceae bacterium]|jgi:hypothetical protein|nr:hypothetical protein [Micromonosporaceae bacterium]